MSSRLYSKRLLRKAGPRGERKRPKTFKTEEKAKTYAELKGIKSYKIEPKASKFVITK